MDCQHAREALSARLDGESSDLDARAVDGHLTGCSACTRWAEQVTDLHRLVRVRAAEPVPDLSATIMERASLPAAAARWWSPLTARISTARWALLVVAVTQLVLAGPAILLGEDPGATVHVARELGSFDVALAVGLLVAALQPARAWGLLPVVTALALVMGLTAVLDVADGRADTIGEAHHLLDLAGVALLWLVAHEARATSTRRRRPWAAA